MMMNNLVDHFLDGRHEVGQPDVPGVGGDGPGLGVHPALLQQRHTAPEAREPSLAPLGDFIGLGQEPPGVKSRAIDYLPVDRVF